MTPPRGPLRFITLSVRFTASSSSLIPPAAAMGASLEHRDFPGKSAMDLFFKGKILGMYLKPKTEKRADEVPNPGNGDLIPPSSVSEVEEEEDDFVAQEIKRRLRELKRSGCMGLIPEGDDEEEEEDVDVFPWRSFCDNFYRKYCDQMLFFEKIIIARHRCHKEDIPATDLRFDRAVSRYRFLSFKKKDSQLAEESQRLCEQGDEGEDDFGNLETAYVAHLALTWEALHCQHSLLKQSIEEEEEGHVISYGSAAEAFQQFQVLLQRFVENEPFEPGSRVQIYSRARMAMPKLLQVPSLRGLEVEAEGLDPRVRGVDFLKVVEESVLVFRHFLKAEKTKPASRSVRLHGCAAGLQQARLSLSKREMKLKELLRKKKMKRKVSSSWPGSVEDVDLLFGLIDLRVVSRVLRMARISKEQMLWCEEKMGKLGFSNGKLHRDGAPLLFPS